MRLVFAISLGLFLVIWGIAIDFSTSLNQNWIFGALQVASLAGAAVGYQMQKARMATGTRRLALFFAMLLSWRLAYFPAMVFSGHVATIKEWVLIALGLPIVIYPTFLLSVMLLHAAASSTVSLIIRRSRWRFGRLFAVLVFGFATVISFNSKEDLRIFPDEFWEIETNYPEPQEGIGNPYRPEVMHPSYTFNQRVMLFAASVTYDTIPGSPWGTVVKTTLENLFRENSHASTTDRVLEHYVAYHVAHPFIGCRDFESCPLPREECVECPDPVEDPEL